MTTRPFTLIAAAAALATAACQGQTPPDLRKAEAEGKPMPLLGTFWTTTGTGAPGTGH